MLIPRADGLAPVCGAPIGAACSSLQAVVTCGPCRDIVRARLAFLQQAIGEPEVAAIAEPASQPKLATR